MAQVEIKPNGARTTTLDAVVIGAGIAGLYQLYRIAGTGTEGPRL